ncbi:MAG: hypothetical protein ACR2G4_10725 [Pyrinomonadaceae bacterium]
MKKKSQLSFAHPSFDKPPTPEAPLTITLLEDVSTPEQPDELSALKQLDKTAFNACAEELFLDLICSLLDEGELSVREAIVEGAFELNISPETSKRYISKHSARRARFSLVGGKVQCKIHDHKHAL